MGAPGSSCFASALCDRAWGSGINKPATVRTDRKVSHRYQSLRRLSARTQQRMQESMLHWLAGGFICPKQFYPGRYEVTLHGTLLIRRRISYWHPFPPSESHSRQSRLLGILTYFTLLFCTPQDTTYTLYTILRKVWLPSGRGQKKKNNQSRTMSALGYPAVQNHQNIQEKLQLLP